MSKITALLQRLLALRPFRRQSEDDTDTAESSNDGAVESSATDQASASAVASAPEDAEDDMDAMVAQARKRLAWKKRVIIAVPALLLVVLVASIAAWWMGSPDEATEQHDATAATATPPAQGSDIAPAAVDQVDRAQALEAELKKMKQERNALLIEKNALAERNRKLQEAAARRTARPAVQPRSRSPLPASAANSGSTDTPTPGLSVDCTISGDLETAGELLKHCIEKFNAAGEGR